jgi:ATP-binding cassette, subfamily B, bacterial CvaB/MchF/RaxB
MAGDVFGALSAFGGRRRLPQVVQSEATECGWACLAMICGYFGYDISLTAMRRRFSTSARGATLARLMEMAHQLGFDARPLRVELEYLTELKTPCILHWNLNHFVVLREVTRKGAIIHDPAGGAYCMPMDEVSKRFTGVALELKPGVNFKPVEDKERVSLRALTGHIAGLKQILAQVFGIALVIEALVLLLPFQLQWVMDHVLASADTNLLLVIGVAFSLLVVLQTAFVVARSWIISWFGATLNAQWVTNLFSHLLKLPLEYFEKRHMADILSRFTSVRSIQTTLTGSFIESLLDGVMGVLALMILCMYSSSLTCIVLVAFVIYGALRWLMYRQLWRINEEQLIYGARQQGELMESVRGAQAIKLANKQNERRARLADVTLAAAERDMRSQRIGMAFSAINQGLFGLQRVVLISLGAWFTLRGKFSAGMLVAFVAYADQFTTKLGNVVDKLVELNMLKLHAERISDIALTEPEAFVDSINAGVDPSPSIEVRNLSFRYSVDEPWILRNLNLTIFPNESVAIVGASGCGKSTLAKLILGLLSPTEGSISMGGVDIRKLGLRNYRNMVSAVMQDDQLFAGSVADNIAFFDADCTLERIEAAARAAAIHDEIVAMPMGYESLVGDMGSSLSGGQKQRVLLARALYREPKILILDEASSHLDVQCEIVVNRNLSENPCTKFVIAHRKETIDMCDRFINLSELDDRHIALMVR